MGSTAFQYNRTAISVKNARPRDLARLLDAVFQIGTGLDLQALLRRLVEAAVELVDARYGALGVLDGTGDRLAEWITVGVDDGTCAAIGDLPKGLGLLGSLITDATPLRVTELSDHPDSSGFPPNHPSTTSFLGVPIRVRGEVFANLYLTTKATGDEFTVIDEELALGLAVSAGAAIENAHLYERSRLREAAMAAMKAVATTVLTGADLRSNLELVARQAQEVLAADIAIIALAGQSGLGAPEQVIAITDGPIGEAMRRKLLIAAGTAPGDVLDDSGPAGVVNGSHNGRIGSDLLRDGRTDRTLIVALIVDGQSLGALTLVRAAPAAPFTPDELEVAESFATQGAFVVQQEHLARQRQRMTLLDDQERIGRDLHDTVIQHLFATGLSLQAVAMLSQDPEVQQRVSDAVDELDRTIAHIRTVIFDLETPNSAERLGGALGVSRPASGRTDVERCVPLVAGLR